MRHETVFAGLATLVLLALAAPLGADPPPPDLAEAVGHTVRVETLDGSSFVGRLLSVADDRLEVVLVDGRILALHRPSVAGVQVFAGDASSRMLFEDAASNRLIVTPTGFAMSPGEFHVSDQEVAVITSSYGLSERATLWGGISPMGALVSARRTLFLRARTAVSVGAFGGAEWVGEDVGANGLVMPYVTGSRGDPNHNVTAAGAFAFHVSGAGADPLAAVLQLGGKLVLNSSTALVTENWIIWSERTNRSGRERWDAVPVCALFGLVYRIAGGRLSGDLGAVLPIEVTRTGIRGASDGVYVPVPLLSLTYRIQ